MKPRKEHKEKAPHRPTAPEETERGKTLPSDVEPGKAEPDKREEELTDDEILDKEERGESF